MPINKKATIFLSQNSKAVNLLNNLPTPYKVYDISHANIITGSPVAMANTTGKYSPEVEIVSGISIPKYKTPLYGQNASAKITPNKNTSQ